MENYYAVLAAALLLFVLQLSVTLHVLMYKDDVRSSIGWIGLVWLSPLVGSVIYVIFGINRIKRKAKEIVINKTYNLHKLTGKNLKEIESEIPPNYMQFLRLGYKIRPQMPALHNTFTPLLNGDEAYVQMCRAISRATKEVLLQSYIFNNDTAGKMFSEALAQAAQNGAKVKVLVDGIGLLYSFPNIKHELKKIKGVEFAQFLPSRSPVCLPFLNLRNHRKILIIDGKTAFSGGMNIAEGNLLLTKPKEPIQDITFKIEGDVLRQLSTVFLEDWTFSTKKTFTPRAFGLKHITKGHAAARVITDGPDNKTPVTEQLFFGILTAAAKKVTIVTPYFLPEKNILDYLVIAALRGIDVEIILPEKSNIFGIDYAMQSTFGELIQSGVKIYKTKAPFDHSKMFIVDDAWCFLGSANWDARSLRLNFEVNMECFDVKLAKTLLDIIETKKQKAVLVKDAKQSFLRSVRNRVFRLLTPYY